MSKPQSAGAAWKKKITNKNGEEVEIINVIIGDKRYTMWPNKFKQEGEKSPDYRLSEDNFTPEKKAAKSDLPF